MFEYFPTLCDGGGRIAYSSTVRIAYSSLLMPPDERVKRELAPRLRSANRVTWDVKPELAQVPYCREKKKSDAKKKAKTMKVGETKAAFLRDCTLHRANYDGVYRPTTGVGTSRLPPSLPYLHRVDDADAPHALRVVAAQKKRQGYHFVSPHSNVLQGHEDARAV